VLHAVPIVSSLISSSYYLARCKKYEAPHYTFRSCLLTVLAFAPYTYGITLPIFRKYFIIFRGIGLRLDTHIFLFFQPLILYVGEYTITDRR
jgi:hypothetical protein